MCEGMSCEREEGCESEGNINMELWYNPWMDVEKR